jgi:hypothetical protein
MTTTTNDLFDDKIEQWHEGESGKEMHEHLGLTWQQYRDYVEHGAVPLNHPDFKRTNMAIDHERFARIAELATQAWPGDEVSISANASGMYFAAGKSHIVLAHKDLDLFEAALLIFAGKPLELLSTGDIARLRGSLTRLAEAWSHRAGDSRACANELREALSKPIAELE